MKASFFGCVPLPEWTGMDIITGMDYRNGHYAVALNALAVFNLHKSTPGVILIVCKKINFILVPL